MVDVQNQDKEVLVPPVVTVENIELKLSPIQQFEETVEKYCDLAEDRTAAVIDPVINDDGSGKIYYVCVIHIKHPQPAADGHSEDLHYRPVAIAQATTTSLFFGEPQTVVLEDGFLHALKENLNGNNAPDIQLNSLKDKDGREGELVVGLGKVHPSPWLAPGEPVALANGDVVTFEFLPVSANDPSEKTQEIISKMEDSLKNSVSR